MPCARSRSAASVFTDAKLGRDLDFVKKIRSRDYTDWWSSSGSRLERSLANFNVGAPAAGSDWTIVLIDTIRAQLRAEVVRPLSPGRRVSRLSSSASPCLGVLSL